MKNVRKSLGILLVVAMLVSMMSITSFALTDGMVAKFTTLSDKKAYASGDIATFTVSVEVAEDANPFQYAGQIDIAFNTEQFEPITTISATAFSNAGVDYSMGFLAGHLDDVKSKCLLGSKAGTGFLDEDVDNYGWDESINVWFVPATSSESGTISGEVVLFTVQLKAKKDLAEGSFAVGVNPGAAEMGINYINSRNSDYEEYWYDPACIETVIGVAAPAVTVEPIGTMGHMNNWKDTAATTYTAGLLGQINGLALTFDETTGECNEIDEIKVTIEGSDKVGYAYQVYKVNDTTYQFRAILLDAPKTGTTALNYTFHVKLSDGTVLTCSDSTTTKEIFDAAYSRYQAANP